MGKTIHLKGSNARVFMAMGLVDTHGKDALDKCSGPMRLAVEDELNRRAAEKSEATPTGDLPGDTK